MTRNLDGSIDIPPSLPNENDRPIKSEEIYDSSDNGEGKGNLLTPSTKSSPHQVEEIFGRQISSNREVMMHEPNSSEIKPATTPESSSSSSRFKRPGKKTWTDLWKLTPSKKKHHLVSSEDSDGSTYSSPKLHETQTPLGVGESPLVEPGVHENESRKQDIVTSNKLSNSPSQEIHRFDDDHTTIESMAATPTTADHVTSPLKESPRLGMKQLNVDNTEVVRKDNQDILLNSRERELEQLTVHCDDILGQLTENTNELDRRLTNLKEAFEDSTTSCESYQEELKKHAKQALDEIHQVHLEITQHQLDFDRMGDQIEQSQEELEKVGQQINVWHDRINGLHLELRFLQWQMKRNRLRDIFYVILSWVFQLVAFGIRLYTKVYMIVRGILISMFPTLLNENDRRRQLQRRLRRMSSSLQPEEWARRLKGYFEKQEQTTTVPKQEQTTTVPKQDIWKSSPIVESSSNDKRTNSS